MKESKKPNLWLTILRRILIALIWIALVGLGLYFTVKFNTYSPGDATSDQSWGISQDSPIRNFRK